MHISQTTQRLRPCNTVTVLTVRTHTYTPCGEPMLSSESNIDWEHGSFLCCVLSPEELAWQCRSWFTCRSGEVSMGAYRPGSRGWVFGPSEGSIQLFCTDVFNCVSNMRVNLSTVDVTFPDVNQFSLKARQGDQSPYIIFLITWWLGTMRKLI